MTEVLRTLAEMRVWEGWACFVVMRWRRVCGAMNTMASSMAMYMLPCSVGERRGVSSKASWE